MSKHIVVQYWKAGNANKEIDPVYTVGLFRDVEEYDGVERYLAKLSDGSDLILLVAPKGTEIDPW